MLGYQSIVLKYSIVFEFRFQYSLTPFNAVWNELIELCIED